ncbi:ADP-ribosylglycohydrolase family protein [Flavobacterium davisii]|uniref:ADP-ribosylglycohydrolase family protein n=1 Tax=Flavobacterium davisii TaxID=2906077 RepID=UPI0035CF1EC5
MILQAAIGDAYGAGFEFQKQEFIDDTNDVTAYYPHGLYSEIYKRYTDDTQMAIAITELVLEDLDWTEERVAQKFVEVFHRDKRKGYSDRVYNALDQSNNGNEFMSNLTFQSSGNGSAMRAYPIGFVKDISMLLKCCEIQAKTSHNTIEGIQCAKRIALAVHFYRYGLDGKYDLIEFINTTLNEQETYEIIAPIDMHGYPTTKAVIKLVSEATSMHQCLQEGISYGGDTDTVAALCMAILSQKTNCEKSLPAFLYDELENGLYGKEFLMNLDNKLEEKFKNIN